MDAKKARKLLDAERERLLGLKEGFRKDHLGEESERDSLSELSTLDQHPADIGTETFEIEKDMSILNGIEAELVDIERAAERIEAGTYGVCEACGKAIGEARLQARPAARYCIEDQARVEREARTA